MFEYHEDLACMYSDDSDWEEDYARGYKQKGKRRTTNKRRGRKHKDYSCCGRAQYEEEDFAKSASCRSKSKKGKKKSKKKSTSTPVKRQGSRAEVMSGTARETTGGLTKKDLKYNKQGRIVSVAKSEAAKKNPHFKKMQRKIKKCFKSK